MILIDIVNVQGNKLGDTQAAGDKEHQDRVIAINVRPVAGGEQALAFFLLEIFRKRGLAFGHIQLLTDVIVQQMPFRSEIIEEGFHGTRSAATACG